MIKAFREAVKAVPIYWSLPSFIATNPLWDLHEQPLQEVLINLKNMANVEGVMPFSYYQEKFSKNEIKNEDLAKAIEEYRNAHDDTVSMENIKKILLQPAIGKNLLNQDNIERSLLPPFLVAEKLSISKNKDIKGEIKKAIMQFLMSYFCNEDVGSNAKNFNSIFDGWQQLIVRYNNELNCIVSVIESDKWIAVNGFLNEFNISLDEQVNYLGKIFHSVLGWSSLIKCLEQRPDNPYLNKPAQLIDLVLIWLCYEKYYCKKYSQQPPVQNSNKNSTLVNQINAYNYRFIWQRAFEIAYERHLMNKLMIDKRQKSKVNENKRNVQAIFCIDTRSEGLRRHLEKFIGYETFGFAGFFGFVFNYTNGNNCQSLQCPALFPPDVHLKSEQEPHYLAKQSQHFLLSCLETKKSLLTPMAFVEMTGMWFALMMLIKSYSGNVFKKCKQLLGCDMDENKLQDEISSTQVNAVFSLEAKVNNSKQFLTTIGLTKEFAPIILICGHGGETDNNPYQSSFDCGACGGNAGFANAIVATHILNDAEVRYHLKSFNIHIPNDTYFVAGFHNTTRDQVTLYQEAMPEHVSKKISQLQDDLDLACDDLRLERSQELPGKSSSLERAANWSELIPEMGLINNAALIVGPRHLTQHTSLDRRVFLHSYDPEQDPDGQLLTGILLGPLIVAHWINAQYYFSTTDPAVYGSGNKMLHNVLPNIGVIEGNFSDLKIGLPWQSVAFQNKVLHQPLRLLVIIYARKKLVDHLLEQHPSIKALFAQQWAHLKILEPGD